MCTVYCHIYSLPPKIPERVTAHVGSFGKHSYTASSVFCIERERVTLVCAYERKKEKESKEERERG